jgi:hypothetical protein
VGSPGSRATSFHTCQVLRPRRAVWALAFTRLSVLPSAFATASAPGIRIFTRLNGWPVCSPTDASPPPLRATAHGSGPMWLATPSSYRTCTDYSLPVSRRTAKDSVRHPGRYQRCGDRGSSATRLRRRCYKCWAVRPGSVCAARQVGRLAGGLLTVWITQMPLACGLIRLPMAKLVGRRGQCCSGSL